MPHALRGAVLAGALCLAPSLLTAQPTAHAIAAAACATLTQDEAMQVIGQKEAGNRMIWKSVQIGGARRASLGEIQSDGLPPDAVITPVRVSFSTVRGTFGRDFEWTYFFYQDGSGDWVAQSAPVASNHESDVYYVRPN